MPTPDDLKDELRQHRDDAYRAALAAGCSPAEARARAQAALGPLPPPPPATERQARPPWLADIARDLRYALRGLRRAPGFALLAILTLALGIGANTAIFSWVQAELLASLPYVQPARLLLLQESADGRTVSVSYPDYVSWAVDNAKSQGAFAALAWVQWNHFDVQGAAIPTVVNAADVSANYFSVLGTLPVLGRAFSPGADTAAARHEAVITWALAERQFGAAPRALGQTLDVDRKQALTIVGVLAPDYRDPNQTDMFTPDGLDLADNADRGNRGDSAVIGRLAPGATPAVAAAEMRAEMGRLAAVYPDDHAVGAVISPMRAAFVGTDAAMLWLLLAAVGVVLLIACANVANLMLVRTAARQQEFAVRAALGAGRGRLLRQLLIESLVLALLGGAAGVAVALAALPALQRLAGTLFTLRLSWPVLAFTLAASVVAAVIFGLAPARLAGRSFRWSARGAAGAGGWGRGLVVAEVALALMLTAVAGLMLRSLGNLAAVDPGFQPQNVLTLSRRLAGPRYAASTAVLAFEQQALERLAALPGVEAAGLGTELPLTGDHGRSDVSVVGRPTPERGHFPHPDFHFISPGYLPALGLPLIAGRNFGAGDGPATAPVALISEKFARAFWKQPAAAIGQQLCCVAKDRPWTIVGVVGNTRQYGLDAAENYEVYIPFTQSPPQHPTLVLRTAVPPVDLTGSASAIFHDLDPGLPLPVTETMSQVVAESMGQPRTLLWLLGVFGGLALVLAAIGIYGVVSYSTRRRTAEIGIRMALGAPAATVGQMVALQSLKLILIGVALGLAGAWLAGPALGTFLFGVGAHDPVVLAAAAVALVAVGLLACALPAWRAARLDPLTALRRE